MNVHPYTVFNTVIHNNREVIPFIPASDSLYPDTVHLQMEDIKQDIQDATSDYLISTPIPDTRSRAYQSHQPLLLFYLPGLREILLYL